MSAILWQELTTACGWEPSAEVSFALRPRFSTLLTFYGGEGTAKLSSSRTLHLDDDAALWIGTGAGLARSAHGKMASFTRAQGLPDDVISQILEDGRGNFWFTDQGICVARRELEEVAAGRLTRVSPIAYGLAEGMESLECTGGFQPAGLKTRDGKLWFSTVKGLVMVDPANIAVNETPPPVRIEELSVDGVPVTADLPNTRHGLRRHGRRCPGR